MPFAVRFDPSTRVLHSSVEGVLSAREVEDWSRALHDSTAALPASAEFLFLSDLQGYEVADQDLAVHKRMREVHPLFLAAHGFALGFWRLYGQTPPAPSRSGACVRVAHLHHDLHKMERYEELLASPVERFFRDRKAALEWLAAS